MGVLAGGERVEDPYTALCDLAGETLWIKEAMRRRVQALEEVRYRTDSEQTRAELTVYMRLLDQCTSQLATLAKLGLDDRRVRVQEAHVALISTTVVASLRAAGLEGAPLQAAQREVARRLRAHVGPPGG